MRGWKLGGEFAAGSQSQREQKLVRQSSVDRDIREQVTIDFISDLARDRFRTHATHPESGEYRRDVGGLDANLDDVAGTERGDALDRA